MADVLNFPHFLGPPQNVHNSLFHEKAQNLFVQSPAASASPSAASSAKLQSGSSDREKKSHLAV